MQNQEIKKRFLYDMFYNDGAKSYFVANIIISLLIVVSIFVIIIESVPQIEIKYGNWFLYLEIFFTAVFFIEYVSRIIAAPKKLKYIFSALGIIDFLAIFPPIFYFIFPVFFADIRALRALRTLRVLRLLRSFRLIRVITFTRTQRHGIKQAMSRMPWINIEIYFFVLFSVIIISGTLLYLVESRVPDTQFTNIPQGLWWSVVTLTTVGYGDMVPVTIAGKILAAITMFIGLSLFALLIVVIGRAAQIILFGSLIENDFSPSYEDKNNSNN